MRGTFLKATSCADCQLTSPYTPNKDNYCMMTEAPIYDYIAKQKRHPDCPMIPINPLKEVVEAWLKAEGADGLYCKVEESECCCGMEDKFYALCLNQNCRPAKYNKDGKLELMEDK